MLHDGLASDNDIFGLELLEHGYEESVPVLVLSVRSHFSSSLVDVDEYEVESTRRFKRCTGWASSLLCEAHDDDKLREVDDNDLGNAFRLEHGEAYLLEDGAFSFPLL